MTIGAHVPNAQALDLLRRTLEFITEHPEAHSQDDWLTISDDERASRSISTHVTPQSVGPACGTAGCLAGNAVVLSNRYPVRITANDGDEGLPYLQVFVFNQWSNVAAWVEPLATELLDLTPPQVDRLFEGSNLLTNLWAYAAVISDGAIVPPAHLGLSEHVLDHAREQLERSYHWYELDDDDERTLTTNDDPRERSC